MSKTYRIPKNDKPKSEFLADPDCYVIFETNGLSLGRMISSSKSTYCKEHQGDLVIFNANIITKTHGKVWYGDLNVNEDFDNLKNVADQIDEDLYILMEGDARFGYEKQPIKDLISKARTVIKCKRCNIKENNIPPERYNKRKKRKYSKKSKNNGTNN